MALSQAQLIVLKADILANSGPGGVFEGIGNDPDGHQAIADIYNSVIVPDFFVWRTFVDNMVVKEDGVNWTEVINRSAGERFAYDLLTRDGGYNPSKPNIRQGFLDIFSGPQGATSRANLLDISSRKATRAEKLFADITGGNGLTKPNSATMTVEGQISGNDVEAARELP